MIVQIPQTFENIFLKDFKQYHFSVEGLARKLKGISTIHIQEPIYKVKFFLNGIAMRWLVVKKGNVLVPLLVLLKDSKEWKNLVLDKQMKKIVDNLLLVYQNDFLNKKFTTYS